jgi:hypothetical protein
MCSLTQLKSQSFIVFQKKQKNLKIFTSIFVIKTKSSSLYVYTQKHNDYFEKNCFHFYCTKQGFHIRAFTIQCLVFWHGSTNCSVAIIFIGLFLKEE